MKFRGSVSLRPVRIGFLVPVDDINVISRVTRLAACLWGGRYNPLIPCFDRAGDRWVSQGSAENAQAVSKNCIDFFEPDILVEVVPGTAEGLGWHASDRSIGLPRILSLDQFYELDDRGEHQFLAGIDVIEVMSHLYKTEYQYERRHKVSFAKIEEKAGDAFFDVVCGRYPTDNALEFFTKSYDDIFDPETLVPDASTALKWLNRELFGPLWIASHELEERSGGGIRDPSYYVFDPRDPGDVIDYWNFRLVEAHVTPINIHWFEACAEFVRDQIIETHRPIPGNSSGLMFHSTVYFASSISSEQRQALTREHLSGLPAMSHNCGNDPLTWCRVSRGHHVRKRKVLAYGKTTSFEEEVTPGKSCRIPAVVPTFWNHTGAYATARWVNVIVPGHSSGEETPAVVYPTNLWWPGYPQARVSDGLRIGREGWVLQMEHSSDHSFLNIQTGREAIVGWLETQGVDARPSEEGQVAAQVIAVAGGITASGMFADRETLRLLGSMAESHSDVVRNGQQTSKSNPDRAKHINQVRQHFDNREKRNYGYWSKLDYFLDRSVFRAGLRVQCPVCSHYNWFDLNAISYKPTCNRCLKEFQLSQSPKDLGEIGWYYRLIGPFAAPDYARGGYAVALTLRALAEPHDTEMTWSTGLSLKQLQCEVDFIAWQRPSRFMDDERDEPLLVIGEAKSFGRNAINEESLAALKKVAKRFPGAVLVVSTLRDSQDLTLGEIGRLRHLAMWGNGDHLGSDASSPLVVLTGTELFAQHGIAQAWRAADGKEMHGAYDVRDLRTLATLTQKRYLALDRYQRKNARNIVHGPIASILNLLATRK